MKAANHACWHCHWWGGVDTSGSHALCDRPKSSRVVADAETGCAFYVREPGSDDEPIWCPIATAGPSLSELISARRR
jgi:hypothetical protein